MSIQTNNRTVAANEITECLRIPTTSEHAYVDVILTNGTSADILVKIYISSASNPSTEDMIWPEIKVEPRSVYPLTYVLLGSGEAIFTTTTSSDLNVRCASIERSAI